MKRKISGKSDGHANGHSSRRVLDFESSENSSSDVVVVPPKKRREKTNARTLKRKRKRTSTESADSKDSDDTVNIRSDEADIGIIEKVTLKNFMCHSNLEFEFGPNVNFIIGRNGSGKSAILSGIMIALGSRASSTGRSQNLAGYIQTNKQVAFTTVTLRNTGPDAYLPTEYGPRITIERKIGQDGHSFYKLKAANGKLVTMKKEELNNILDALNIQVENPVSILTQDASKCFLDSKDVKKKYELFFKATQLEKLKAQYDEAEMKRQQASSNLKNKKIALPNAAKEVLKLEKQVKHIQLIRSQHDVQHALQNELAWAVVNDAENKVEEARKLVEKFKKEVKNFHQKITGIDDNISTCYSDIAKLKEEESSAKNEMDRLRTIHDESFKTYQDLKRDCGILQIKHDNIILKVETIQVEIEHVQNTLDELTQRSQEDLNSEKQRREEELLELEKIGHKLMQSCQKSGRELEEQNNRVMKKEESIFDMNQEIGHLENMAKQKEYRKSTMESSISNQEYRFGPKVPLLRQRIVAERQKFQQQPIGPIGLFVKIAEECWSFAVEKYLSRKFLNAFCCDNVKDSHVLRAIMKEVLGPRDNPQIIISKFVDKVYDVSQNKVQSNYKTVYDMVNSDNPIIVNSLIDQKSIENVLLIEDPSAAVSLMLHSPPLNCLCTYTMTGDQIYPDPNYRYYSCKQKVNSYALLQRYSLDDIRATEQEIQDLRQTKATKVCARDLENNDLKTINTYVRELQVKQSEIKRKIRANDQRKTECLTATSNEVDVSAMTAELDTQIILKNKYKSESNYLTEEIKEKTAESKNQKKVADESDVAMNVQKDNRRKLMHDIELVEQKRARFVKEKCIIEKQIEKDKSSMEDAEQHQQGVCRDLKVSAEAAAKLCERILTSKSVVVLKSKLKELESVIKEQTANINPDEIIENFVTKKNQLLATEKEIENLKEEIKTLKVAIIERQRKFNEIRSSITLRVQYLFHTNLQTRRFSGRLEFDHGANTLSIAANPNTTEKLTSKQINPNLKTYSLSGGERSFVTVALLMALSDTSEIPFHILDEYDVFMDNMNKEQSLKMMIEKAKEQRNNQFIFLSPLDLPPSAFTGGSLIQIHRMPDPERGAVRPVEEMEEN